MITSSVSVSSRNDQILVRVDCLSTTIAMVGRELLHIRRDLATAEVYTELEKIIQRIDLLKGLYFENEKNVRTVEEKYKINLLKFSSDRQLSRRFIEAIGYTQAPESVIDEVAPALKTLIKTDVIPSLCRHQSSSKTSFDSVVVSSDDFDLFVTSLATSIEPFRLIEILETPQQALDVYYALRNFKNHSLDKGIQFPDITEDLESRIFSAQAALLRLLHKSFNVEQTTTQEIENWNALLKEAFTPFENHRSLEFEVLKSHKNEYTVTLAMPNIVNGRVQVAFHALPIRYKYIRSFSSERIKPGASGKAQISEGQRKLSDMRNFMLPNLPSCNCMSFAVGRRAPTSLSPNRKGTTPNRLSDIHKELIECGCINVESIHANDLTQLINGEGQIAFNYLTAFIYDPGGSETEPADFHVYRCFFNEETTNLVWMELAKVGGIQYSKTQEEGVFIEGIPSNPQSAFCKDSWRVFLGYWLIPPDANFDVEVGEQKTTPVVKHAQFVNFTAEA